MSLTEEAEAAANTTDAAPGDAANQGDEQGGGTGLTTAPTPELTDPAILAVNPKFRYSKDELLKLRDAPLSQKKPDFLDVNEVSPTIWDPSRWSSDRKKTDTPTENGARNGDEHRRRPGDPRERLRKENDGIVLSPQRRSFNSGCCVPGREPRSAAPGGGGGSGGNHRPHSPLGGGAKSDAAPHHLGGGSGGAGGGMQTTNRRIGSGRILRDPWDFGGGGDKQESNDSDYYRASQNGGDRRSFGRDYDRDREKEKDRRGGGRYRRVGGGDHLEEPEWFSGGPSSQNDTIELRGFDESDRMGKKKMSPSQAKRARDWFKKKSEVPSVTEEKEELSIEGGPEGRSTPTPQEGGGDKDGGEQKDSTDKQKVDGGDGKQQPNGQQEKTLHDQSHLFEDILKCETIPGLPGLLPNGVGGDGDTNGKSRFSKWFNVVENNNQSDSRRSSIQDEAIIKNLLNEPSVSIPGDSSSYFAPISPAANTGTGLGGGGGNSNVSKSVMEMLQRGKHNEALKNQLPGCILNLNEIESKMRQASAEQPGPMHKHPQKTEEDLTAFSRLLANMTSHHGAATNGPIKAPSQPMSLMEMLSHSQQLDEAHARLSQQLLGPASPGAAAAAAQSAPHDLAARLQNQQKHQHQVEMLTKLMNAGMQIRASPLPEMGLQQSRELLSRPEAQAILQALHQRIPSPRELQVHTQNILQRALIKKKLEEQQENFRKKQEMQQRGQSPNNNANATNNNNNGNQPTKSVSSPTPLAFTPTSVLRKMTAEKDEGGKDVSKLIDGVKQLSQGRAVTGMRPPSQQAQQPPGQQQQQAQQQWPGYQLNMKQAGRPIVKANSFQPQQQQPQEFFSHQKFFTQLQLQHQQQQQQARKTQQQQQQQQQQSYHGGPPTTSHGSIQGHHPQYTNPNSQQFSQLTQQQLRAQHQQHARPANQQPQQQQQQQQQGQQQYGNQQGTAAWQQYLNPQQQNRGQVGRGGGVDGDLSPTSNQLTRWFSPDLLERARIGELPSTAGLSQNLLSLEEIERLAAPPVHN